MSANNWRICPKCKVVDDAARTNQADLIGHSYGKASKSEYEKLCNELKDWPDLEESLREDWELGTGQTGAFYVSYHCQCQQCGFKHSFKHEEQLKVNLST